jgi:hypothetical protein
MHGMIAMSVTSPRKREEGALGRGHSFYHDNS